MTEEEWLRGIELGSMVQHLNPSRYDRKLRLFAVACCRSVWSTLDEHPEFQRLIEASEDFADGKVSQQHLRESHGATVRHDQNRAHRAIRSGAAVYSASWTSSADSYLSCGRELAECMVSPEDLQRGGARVRFAIDQNLRLFANHLRDICGNPFRPVTFDPLWRTSDVVGLAQAMYEERAFERLPILSDALMEAGCERKQIIAHCRGEGTHVRGCWIVDLVLGKS
jgi:hypothetical protein